MKNFKRRHFCKKITYSLLALNLLPSIAFANSGDNEVIGQNLEINGKK